MAPTVIDEPVSVGAVFREGKIYPRWFLWKGHRVEIQKTLTSWRVQDWLNVHLHFAVTNGASQFELSLDLMHLHWKLEASEG